PPPPPPPKPPPENPRPPLNPPPPPKPEPEELARGAEANVCPAASVMVRMSWVKIMGLKVIMFGPAYQFGGCLRRPSKACAQCSSTPSAMAYGRYFSKVSLGMVRS